MFSFVGDCHTAFQRDWPLPHCHRPSVRVPVAPRPYQNLAASVFWILALLIGVSWCHRCLNLQFFNDMGCWTSFHMPICRPYIFLVRCLFRTFAHLVSWIFYFLLNFLSSLYVLDYKSFIGYVLANVFSLSVVGLFIPWTVSFTEQGLLILTKLSLLSFPFRDHALGIVSQNSLTNPRSPGFSPMILSSSILGLHFTLKSVIHFELIVLKVKGLCLDDSSSFFFCLWMSSFPSTICRKKPLALSPLICLRSFVKDQSTTRTWSILWLSSVPPARLLVLPTSRCLDCCSAVQVLKSAAPVIWPCSSPQRCAGYSGSSAFACEF